VRFALAKFRPTTLPTTLVTRPALHGRLAAGASQRLTVVVGSAGAGKERAAVQLGGDPPGWRDIVAVV
jgi:ATP/maltotriose-dependent transcriptional regulator MalT